jgi:hypothetical protein
MNQSLDQQELQTSGPLIGIVAIWPVAGFVLIIAFVVSCLAGKSILPVTPCQGKGEWSPDHTQLICNNLNAGSWGSFIVYNANGEKLLSSTYSAYWSPDGRYLVANTCIGSHGQPGQGWIVYDTSSWEKICWVATDSMICPNYYHLKSCDCLPSAKGERGLAYCGYTATP